MNRRRLLSALALLALPCPLPAHTPYRQWKIYRQRYLLVMGSRDDPRSDELAERFASTLLARLPASRARAARAPHVERIASLIATNQLDVAVLQGETAAELLRGDSRFAETGAVPLRALVDDGEHQLVCRADFPDRHAYLVSEALMQQADELRSVALAEGERVVPFHPGTLSFLRREPFEE